MLKNNGNRIFLGFIFGIIFGIIFKFNKLFLISIGFNFLNLKIIGDVFLNLIKMMSIPLIFFSVTDSIISIDGFSKSGKVILKSISVFLITTVFCVISGIISVSLFNIGKFSNLDINSITSNISDSLYKIINNYDVNKNSFSGFILDIIPSNIFESFLKGNFLQIIFFSIIIGVAIINSKEDLRNIKSAIKSFSAVTMNSIQMLMKIAPIAIFSTTAWLFSTQDFNLIKSLGLFIGLNYFNAFCVLFLCYGFIIFFILKLNPFHFYRKVKSVQIMAYLTDSTAVTMPTAMKLSVEKIGISKEKVSLIMPIGMTINMNGGALYLGGCAIFLAQVFGIELNFYKYITLIVMSTLSAIGTAPVPGSSILLLGGILVSIGIPIEAIAIIFPIDRILDMCRTVVNVTGDIVSAMIVDRSENTFNEKIYNSN